MTALDTSPADALLSWIIARGGECAFRDIVQRAPGSFRSKATAAAAIAALLADNRLEETSPRPRTFRVVSVATVQSVASQAAVETVAEPTRAETVATVAERLDRQTAVDESVARQQCPPAKTVASVASAPTVAAAPAKARDPRDHYCHCGAIAHFGVGCFLNPSPAERWFCAEHVEPRGTAA